MMQYSSFKNEYKCKSVSCLKDVEVSGRSAPRCPASSLLARLLSWAPLMKIDETLARYLNETSTSGKMR